MRVLALADKFASLLHDLPLLNERGLLMTEVNLQPQTVRVLNDGANCGVHDLIVQTDLDVVADFALWLVALFGWHTPEFITV
jgi:hypothetical protein